MNYDHLVPLELERELLSGVFRAAVLDDEQPNNPDIERALHVVGEIAPDEWAYREHAQIAEAIAAVIRASGTASPVLVKNELRARKHSDALRLLGDLVFYSFAPLRAVPFHVNAVKDAANQRALYKAAQDTQARVLAGDLS